MNLFADYVEPFTTWLRIHPDWALFITFIISFSESLAIIGSIIPGSVTMTAIGILAGSGIMRIDLTLLFACIGAILGDGVSYILGYILRDRLPTLWPFKRYPSWLEYGKNFFARHGGKSILLGRFVGPLRSIIPVIAGMLHMPKLEFIIANIGSGIAWSIVYVMPGILLGAASVQLSTEQATRLFILVLLILAFVWLSSRIIKWLVLRTQVFFETTVHDAWYSAKKTKRFGNILHYITPPHEINHQNTVALIVLGVMCIYLFVIDNGFKCFYRNTFLASNDYPNRSVSIPIMERHLERANKRPNLETISYSTKVQLRLGSRLGRSPIKCIFQ